MKLTPEGGQEEEWITLDDGFGNLIPFQYHLKAYSQYGALDIYYDTIKRPLMVGGQGYLYQGESSEYYYFSYTGMNVTGTITLNDYTEPVTGIGWADKWFGDFHDDNYEWFSVRLSNGMDLNFYNVYNADNQIPDTSNYQFCSIYIDENTTNHTSEFELNRLSYLFMPDSGACYSQQWHLTMPNMDLTITTRNPNCESTYPRRAYEGSTTIEGVVNGEAVTGMGQAELTHHYVNPQINVVNPNGGEIWDGSQPVTWDLLNPDDGCPIYYDLEYSEDGGSSFIPIVGNLTDTTYFWDVSQIISGTECLLRVIGHSVDGTLVGTDISDDSFEISSQYLLDWKTYPYHEDGSLIYFPDDEGWHPSEANDGWYVHAHVTGVNSGKEYTLLLFYWLTYAPCRFFSISDDTNEEFFQEYLPANFTELALDHLEINLVPQGGQAEEWVTLEDVSQNLIPFQYHIYTISHFGELDINLDINKRPLMVGGQGYLNQGTSSSFHYFSYTLVDVSGMLTLNDFTEPISGTGWIDKTYGQFVEDNYEWFSAQLSNGMDLNFYNIFNAQDQIPDSPNYKFCSAFIDENTTNYTSDL